MFELVRRSISGRTSTRESSGSGPANAGGSEAHEGAASSTAPLESRSRPVASKKNNDPRTTSSSTGGVLKPEGSPIRAFAVPQDPWEEASRIEAYPTVIVARTFSPSNSADTSINEEGATLLQQR